MCGSLPASKTFHVFQLNQPHLLLALGNECTAIEKLSISFDVPVSYQNPLVLAWDMIIPSAQSMIKPIIIPIWYDWGGKVIIIAQFDV